MLTLPKPKPIPEEPSPSNQSGDTGSGSGTANDILHRYGHWISFVVAVGCAIFVLLQLRPDLLVTDTTPSGGDMGAHVWGPAYMRDHLLTQGRLTGWTPDWYAGFPAYVFYMIAPPLAIITVNAGFNWLIGIPLAIAAVAGAWFVSRMPRVQGSGFVGLVRTLGILVAISVVFVPYGAAFKLVSVSGLILMPIAGWAMAKMSKAVEPIPALTAIGVTVFLFDTNFNIYGGNIASTLAGEFAFSISLTVAILYLGVALRGRAQFERGCFGDTLYQVGVMHRAETHIMRKYRRPDDIAMTVDGVGAPDNRNSGPAAAGINRCLIKGVRESKPLFRRRKFIIIRCRIAAIQDRSEMIALGVFWRNTGDIGLDDLANFFFNGHARDNGIDARFHCSIQRIGPIGTRPNFGMDGGRQITVSGCRIESGRRNANAGCSDSQCQQ